MQQLNGVGIKKWIPTNKKNYISFVKWFTDTYPKYRKYTKGDYEILRLIFKVSYTNNNDTYIINRRYFVPFIKECGYTIQSRGDI